MSSGSQKIHATKDREKEAGERYKKIRKIIIENSSVPFKDIIEKIANIKVGSFYNYTSEKSEKYGRISQYTVNNLSNYFNLPIGVFNCTLPFTEEDEKAIKNKIIEDFSSDINKMSNKGLIKNNLTDAEILQTLISLAEPITNISNLELCSNIHVALEKLLKIVDSRIEILEILSNLR